MSNTSRHDALVLNAGVDADAFEHVMTAELMLHLARRFLGPTRSSRADLKAQSLVRDAKAKRKLLLVTVWKGAPASVAGAEFENARMNTVAGTTALLKQLDEFAKRSAKKVFTEVSRMDVPTNV